MEITGAELGQWLIIGGTVTVAIASIVLGVSWVWSAVKRVLVPRYEFKEAVDRLDRQLEEFKKRYDTAKDSEGIAVQAQMSKLVTKMEEFVKAVEKKSK